WQRCARSSEATGAYGRPGVSSAAASSARKPDAARAALASAVFPAPASPATSTRPPRPAAAASAAPASHVSSRRRPISSLAIRRGIASVGGRGALHRQALLLPRPDAAVQVGDVRVAHALQRGGGQRRAAARGAVQDDAPVGLELGPVVA